MTKVAPSPDAGGPRRRRGTGRTAGGQKPRLGLHGKQWVSTRIDLSTIIAEAEAGQLTQEELDRVVADFLGRLDLS